ncbi:hypothetical protein P3L10_011202 [Capsicum annuum]
MKNQPLELRIEELVQAEGTGFHVISGTITWKMLDGKKYRLALDDVWNEDNLKCSTRILIGGTKGSKILLPTRSDVVAEVSGSVHQHKLGDCNNPTLLEH